MPHANPYTIPSFGGSTIPSFGGYGAGDAAADRAHVESLFPEAEDPYLAGLLLGGRRARSSNPNPFYSGRIDPKTGYETRKRAKRIYAPAMAALVAQNALLGPTAQLEARGGDLYSDLYARIAPQYLEGYAGADEETSGLLSLVNEDARSLVGRSADPYADRDVTQSLRTAQASRGMGYSPSDAIREVLALDRARDERRMARGRYAGEAVEMGRRYYSPALISLLQRYQSPVQGTQTDDLLSLSLNDTAQRRNEQAARRAGQMALTGQIISSVLGAAGTAAGGA